MLSRGVRLPIRQRATERAGNQERPDGEPDPERVPLREVVLWMREHEGRALRLRRTVQLQDHLPLRDGPRLRRDEIAVALNSRPATTKDAHMTSTFWLISGAVFGALFVLIAYAIQSQTRRILFGGHVVAAKAAAACGDLDHAWRSLERAHVLSQFHAGPHVRVHCAMVAFAWRRRDFSELLGQVPRLILAAPGSWTGRAPRGNTGGSDVGIFTPMEIPQDLSALLAVAGEER